MAYNVHNRNNFIIFFKIYDKRKTGLHIMGALGLGTAGFLLYFIYDANSIKWNNHILQKFFGVGSLCVVIATVWTLAHTSWSGGAGIAARICFGAGGFFFLALLIYTLFFALPFDKTYLEDNKKREAYTEGVYGLCRHPGVLWFAGLYVCLWGVSGSLDQGIFFVSMIIWNYLYIVFQDLWTFPQTFTNYDEYKKRTPFLIPSRKSIQEAFGRNKAQKGVKVKTHESEGKAEKETI